MLERSSAFTSTAIFGSSRARDSLLCDGIYAVDFGMVLICANDPPPRRVFCFGAVHGKVSNRNTIPFAANQIAPRWRIFLGPGMPPLSVLPLFPVAAVEKVDQIVGLFDRHVDQGNAHLDNRQPSEHIDDVPGTFRRLLNVVALSHGAMGMEERI
ncbi:hypothetical protein [Mesorhizobium onobrychidis]|uniref:Uncharacterized protein n=1 Tax=Mesorhizobium onobrychidis TaxID=2775404 RepID=A0ABY5QSA9_9HYPH|nr:hypothetical protein [Mesorhizobium onobrychidis]UVC13597.1 hypothetical protein IHQ72_23150 [Mesorhizobium onobrychidis]